MHEWALLRRGRSSGRNKRQARRCPRVVSQKCLRTSSSTFKPGVNIYSARPGRCRDSPGCFARWASVTRAATSASENRTSGTCIRPFFALVLPRSHVPPWIQEDPCRILLRPLMTLAKNVRRRRRDAEVHTENANADDFLDGMVIHPRLLKDPSAIRHVSIPFP